MSDESGAEVVTRLGFITRLLEVEESRARIFGRGGALKLNLMTEEIELGGVRLGLEDADLVPWRTAVARLTKAQFGQASEPATANLRAVIEYVAQQASYHPVEDWVTGLKWDGTDRLTGGLPAAFGQMPGSLEATMLRKTVRAMVARAVKPGCKVDTVLVLVGGQGKLKSTALAALAAPWFTDQQILVEARDSWEICHRHWVLELGELSALNRADLEQVKAFVSKTDDTFRSAYARKSRRLLRRFILCGTTNHVEFLRDSTGNRRFWPVHIKNRIDVAWLGQNRDQLLAQAAREVVGGATWWLQGEEEEDAHEDLTTMHMESDPWMDPLRDWMEANPDKGRLGVGVAELLHDVLEVPMGRLHGGDGKRVTGVLKRLGASPHRTKTARLWRWGDGSEA